MRQLEIWVLDYAIVVIWVDWHSGIYFWIVGQRTNEWMESKHIERHKRRSIFSSYFKSIKLGTLY